MYAVSKKKATRREKEAAEKYFEDAEVCAYGGDFFFFRAHTQFILSAGKRRAGGNGATGPEQTASPCLYWLRGASGASA